MNASLAPKKHRVRTALAASLLAVSAATTAAAVAAPAAEAATIRVYPSPWKQGDWVYDGFSSSAACAKVGAAHYQPGQWVCAAEPGGPWRLVVPHRFD